KDRAVFVVEGEKDADALAERGLIATTLAGGAGANWTPVTAEPLRGRTDLPGLPPKGDVSDFFELNGNNLEALLKLPIRDFPTDGARIDRPSRLQDVAERDLIRLEKVQASSVEFLWKPWLPLGKLCLIDGDPGQGKSYMTLDLAARLSRGD